MNILNKIKPKFLTWKQLWAAWWIYSGRDEIPNTPLWNMIDKLDTIIFLTGHIIVFGSIWLYILSEYNII
jgi:hypothetical protein